MLIEGPADQPAGLFAPVAQQRCLGLAISGGPDSLALMILAARWAKSCPHAPRLIVYTVDHQLRREAAAEAAMVADYAGTLGLETRVLKWERPKTQTGVQAAARRARYRLIGTAMAKDGAEILLTAHHRGDQAETMLMRMAHGSGVSGLAGMRRFAEVEAVQIFRPLLAMSSVHLREVVTAHGWTPVDDPSNYDVGYERVRWRQAMPKFAALGLTEARLAALAARIERIDGLAEREVEAFWSAHVHRDAFGVLTISRRHFETAEPEIAIRVLSRAVSVGTGRALRSLGAVEDHYARFIGAPAFSRATAGGAVIEADPLRLLIYREVGRMAEPPVVLPRGQAVVWDQRFSVLADHAGLSVAPARDITRKAFETIIGQEPNVPIAALRAAPKVVSERGDILALGTKVLGNGIKLTHLALT